MPRPWPIWRRTPAVHYLIDRFGMHRVQELLAHLKARQALSAAMQSQLSLSYEQFQSRWVSQLQEHEKKSWQVADSPAQQFSHRSDPHRTPEVRLGPSLAAALLDGLLSILRYRVFCSGHARKLSDFRQASLFGIKLNLASGACCRQVRTFILLLRSNPFQSPRALRHAKPAGSRLHHRARLPCLSPPRSARSCLPTLSAGPDHPSFGCETRSAEIGPPTSSCLANGGSADSFCTRKRCRPRREK